MQPNATQCSAVVRSVLHRQIVQENDYSIYQTMFAKFKEAFLSWQRPEPTPVYRCTCDYNLHTCLSLRTHDCICNGSTERRDMKHNCTCSINFTNCQAPNHICQCSSDPKNCRSNIHKHCYCRTDSTICRLTRSEYYDHICMCNHTHIKCLSRRHDVFVH